MSTKRSLQNLLEVGLYFLADPDSNDDWFAFEAEFERIRELEARQPTSISGTDEADPSD